MQLIESNPPMTSSQGRKRKNEQSVCDADGCANLHRSSTGKCPDHREQICVHLGSRNGTEPPRVHFAMPHLATTLNLTVGEAIRLADNIIDTIEGLET